MIIKTKDFGEIHYEDADIVQFVRGIYGFEGYTKYLIIKDEPEDDIMFLQSLEREDLSFVVVDPYAVLADYSPELTEEDLKLVQVNDVHELKFLLIAILSDDIRQSVINLKSPLAINPGLKVAVQAIAQNSDYPVRSRMFASREGGKD